MTTVPASTHPAAGAPVGRRSAQPATGSAAPLDDVTVVIPTVGRPSLHRLLDSLAVQERLPARIVVVDDAGGRAAASVRPAARLAGRVVTVRSVASGGPGRRGPRGSGPPGPGLRGSRSRGPAAARNTGWRAARTTWVVVLDDDVIVPRGWSSRLAEDLHHAGPRIAAVQGRLVVPLDDTRAPTDWERQVAGLESAVWATADMALRTAALADVSGFDERFPRAFREDADLALRLVEAGWQLELGEREAVHPVPQADALVSVRRQAGNADDALMRVLHGRGWRERAAAPQGRRRRHLAVTASGLGAVIAALRGRTHLAALAAAGWAAGTAEFAAARIRPGPRDRAEVATMTLTSVLIPPAAVVHWLRGWAGVAAGRLAGPPAGATVAVADAPTAAPPLRPVASRTRARAVLFDRDGTLLTDVPYNGDPDRVEPVPGAAPALAALRQAGIATAVVSNQSGVARGLITRAQVDAVNDRMVELLGPLGPIEVCPHGPADGCTCRKPAPGMVLAAARRLGVDPVDCVVIGDIASDLAAAEAVGARGVMVPTPVTRPQEIAEAPVTAADLTEAVALVLEGAV